MGAELLHIRVQTENRFEAVVVDKLAESVGPEQRFPPIEILGLREELRILQPGAPCRHDHQLLPIQRDAVVQERVESCESSYCNLIWPVAEILDEEFFLTFWTDCDEICVEACCRFAVVGDHPFGGGDSMLQKDLICLQRSLKLRLSSGIEEVRMMGTDDLVSAERQADMLGRPEIDDMVVAIQVAS